MELIKTKDNSFKAWFFSKHNLVEKSAGIVVLAVELIDLVTHVFAGLPELVLTKLLNLMFLVFIYFQLKREIAKRYNVNPDDPEVVRILRLSHYSKVHHNAKISDLVFTSNTLISQLRDINRFVLATGTLYFLMLAQFVVKELRETETD